MNNHEPKHNWRREPLVWFIISLPLAAVIGGIITIYLAIESDDGLVTDDYYKRGLEVNKTLQRDNIAAILDLKADVSFSENKVNIKLQGNDKFDPPESVHASFLHPTKKGMDREANLLKTTNNDYVATMKQLPAGRWYLLIEAQDWRLLLNYRSQEQGNESG